MIILVCSWLRRVGNASQGVSIYFIKVFRPSMSLFWRMFEFAVVAVFSLLYLEHVEEELAIVFAKLPEEDQQLLVEVNL